MTFREKLAWVMSLVLILAGAFYAWEVVGHGRALSAVPPPSIKLAVVYIGFVIIGSVIGASSVAAHNTEEADAPADERERIAIDKAGYWSGYVLAAGAVAGVLHYWTHQDGNVMFHLVVAALMLSQIAEYAYQIILFRGSRV
ncbi:MAG: hypothetical protein ABJG15_10860 [Hyphomonadaceae bacterium]